MKPEIKELLDRISPEDRINLLAGLKRKHQQETARDAAPIASLLASQLRAIGLYQDAEYVDNLCSDLFNARKAFAPPHEYAAPKRQDIYRQQED